MTAAPQVEVDRAFHRSGTRYAGMVAPADDPRSFPCTRCGTPIELGKIVRGVYDERTARWVVPAAALLAAAFTGLTGWLLGWGAVAAAVVGVLAFGFGTLLLAGLHHDLVENRKLAELERKTEPFVLGRALVLIATAAAAPALATWLYGWLGWLAAAGGILVLLVAVMVALGSLASIGRPRGKSISYAEIAEENRRQAGSQ